MFKTTARAALCLACVWSITPALAAPKEMPQGKRDEMSMKDTKHEDQINEEDENEDEDSEEEKKEEEPPAQQNQGDGAQGFMNMNDLAASLE